jgi:ribosome maturation factor RimP
MSRRFHPVPPPAPVVAPAPAAALDREAARGAIARLASQAAAQEGLEIAWIDAPLEGKNWTVRVFLDRPDADGDAGAVSLGECSRVSEHLSVLLDLEDPVGHPYTLEVSSPGLDRPLFTPADFRRFTGKLAAVITTERVLNQTFFRGRIESSDETRVNLRIEGNKLAEIPFAIINKANLEVEF